MYRRALLLADYGANRYCSRTGGDARLLMSGTCRDSPNIGHHSVKAPLDIGVPDAGEKTPPILDIAGLPVFTITCKLKEGPLAGKIYKLTDLGHAKISRKCKDIGRFKRPIQRGLAARAPYFHIVRPRPCGMSSTSMIVVSKSALPTRTRRISSTSRTHSDEVHDLEKRMAGLLPGHSDSPRQIIRCS
jgi:hypothetical protein